MTAVKLLCEVISERLQVMLKFTKPFLCSFFLFQTMVLSPSFGDSVADEDKNFKWQDAVKELDSLPFKQSFIDSLKSAFCVSAQTALRTMNKAPFCKNETLVYNVSWGPIFAGNLIITTDYDSVSNTIRVGGKAVSSNFVGAFYKMRDYVISTIDASGLYPVFFEQHLREGKRYKNDGWVLYDINKNKVHIKDKNYKNYETPPFTHDYLSVLNYIRNVKPVPGDTFTLHLFINKKIHPMLFTCRDKTILKTDNGQVSCFLIEPRLVGNGLTFNKRDKLEVWISDDSIPTPFLIKSKIKFGSITAKLVWHNHPITHLAVNQN